MIKKFGIIGVCALALTTIISCEKDFNDIGSSIVTNTKFSTGTIELEVEVTPYSIDASTPTPFYKAVRADNIEFPNRTNWGDYWLGVYNNPNAKKIEASFISQVNLASIRTFTDKTYETTDVIEPPVLDEVILKIPLQATSGDKDADGKPQFTLDQVLGDQEQSFTVKVFASNTFLNKLDPTDPTKNNEYLSDVDYDEGTELSLVSTFTFKDAEKDTMFVFDRTLLSATPKTYKDTLKVANGTSITANPFKYIKLDKNFFQTNFIDKYDTADFGSQEEFARNILKGIIIEVTDNGNNGSAVPLTFSNANLSPSIDLLITSTVKNAGGEVIDTVPKNHSYPLLGLNSRIYKMTDAANPTPSNNFVIQGTAGSLAEVKILNDTKLAELKANNWLINDAQITFNVNQTISKDSAFVPQRLFLYQNFVNSGGQVEPAQLSDAHVEPASFNGNVVITEKVPEKYSFRITDYISNLLKGTENYTNDPLVLKVYNNPTDNPVTNGVLDTSVKSYNWNPRAVTLYDGNSANGAKKAILKISYSEKK
ncbi:DUF4270 family protein [uncultured Tenacibaculum sp.]|uniref:DUF4270 family protein n=1 Tax=uncultured Tenacibaculum sp. TaxID=174713 RepID=UPI00263183D7|nr:DUF4270 family protein [uncultured Tenacibaculum sp.]